MHMYITGNRISLLTSVNMQINIPSTEAFALTLLTYIGCGISLVCLALSILFYLSYRLNSVSRLY